jgi:hypothetical protein
MPALGITQLPIPQVGRIMTGRSEAERSHNPHIADRSYRITSTLTSFVCLVIIVQSRKITLSILYSPSESLINAALSSAANLFLRPLISAHNAYLSESYEVVSLCRVLVESPPVA